ncbi:MAG: DAK2 domain-containing protein [Geminicoccaceae bacterium]
MDEQPLAKLIDAMHGTIQSHAAQLDALDEALGDGDHGTNLGKAFAALTAERAQLADLPLPVALARVADIVEREAGGDGGRYYGALCRGMGAAAPAGPADGRALVAMLDAAVKAVQAAGGAAKGDKTLLDVLIPVTQESAASWKATRPGSAPASWPPRRTACTARPISRPSAGSPPGSVRPASIASTREPAPARCCSVLPSAPSSRLRRPPDGTVIRARLVRLRICR